MPDLARPSILPCFAALASVLNVPAGAQVVFVERAVNRTLWDPVDTFALDLDGDGDLDVVGLSGLDGRALVFENLGSAQFAARDGLLAPLPGVARGIPLDADGDGDVDVALVTASGMLVLDHNTGYGATWSRTPLGSGNFDVESAFVVHDFNGDGADDLVVQNGDDVGWYPSASGAPGPYQVIATGVQRGLALVDVDNDGIVDLVTDATGPVTRWLLSDGLGGFTPGAHVHGLDAGTVGDIDGDGIADIVSLRKVDILGFGSYSDLHVEWERGLGSGTFASRVATGAGQSGLCLLHGVVGVEVTLWLDPDRNTDGSPELRTRTLCASGGVDFRESLSSGALAWHPTTFEDSRSKIRHGDVDGDGFTDRFQVDALVSWSRLQNGASYSAPRALTVGAGGSRADVADLDGDGWPDVVAAPVQGGQVALFDGLGNGVFESARVGGAPTGAEPILADLDADGDLDFVYYADGRHFGWTENDGSGGFGATYLVGSGPVIIEHGDIRVADLDGDGLQDVVHTARSSATLRVWYGTGAPGAAAFGPVQLVSSAALFRLEVGDLDGDGDVDVVTYWSFGLGDTVTIHENLGGSFAPGVPIPTPYAFHIALADADRDGDLDIFTAARDGYYLLENLHPAAFAAPTLMPLSAGARYSDLALGDLDGDGFDDLVLVTLPLTGNTGQRVEVLMGGASGFAAAVHYPTSLQSSYLRLRDLDDDRDLDVLLTSSESVAWLENTSGSLHLIGATYCSSAVANSTGVPARIRGIGSESLADDDVTLSVQGLPLASTGYFLASETRGFVPGAGNSQGTFCLGGAVGRYVGPGQVQSSGTTGRFVLRLDLGAMPTPLGPTPALAGSRWNFQAWYRDTNPGPTNNFTDALSVTFVP